MEQGLGGVDVELLPRVEAIQAIAQRECGWRARRGDAIHTVRGNGLDYAYLYHKSSLDELHHLTAIFERCEVLMTLAQTDGRPLCISCLECPTPPQAPSESSP